MSKLLYIYVKMYTDEVRTPQALKTRYYASLNDIKYRVTTSGRRSSSSKNSFTTATATASVALGTPTNGAKHNISKNSPQMNANSTICTPPPKRLQKVRNPFEGALAERLHLPLIARYVVVAVVVESEFNYRKLIESSCSPSLFQCNSRTQQLSSTLFEWDIEAKSLLTPADVEPHETQFNGSPDPEQESKAQLAISTFFKESHIVPSPVDCPLRKQRIVLNELDNNTPISKKTTPARKVRDCEVQTELTLPPVLPKALEEALRPYFQPHLTGPHVIQSNVNVFNTSMRRKLFDLQNIIVLEKKQQEEEGEEKDHEVNVQMVGSSPQAKQTMFAGRLSDSATPDEEGSSSFGCLSPIRNLCGLSEGTPDGSSEQYSGHKRKQLLHDIVDMPSPIALSEHLSRRRNNNSNLTTTTTGNNSGEQHVTLSELTGTARIACKFTPDRSSSPMALDFSIDSSINRRVSRLRVNSAQQLPNKSLLEEVEHVLGGKGEPDADCASETEEDDGEEQDEEEDIMQLSLMSAHSFNCSSSNSDTPRGHRRRRSANRKNLSQSFSANLLDEIELVVEEQETDSMQPQQINEPLQKQGIEIASYPAPQRVGLYRTDSGFNETGSTSNFACSQELPSLDVSMVCCSTPSTRS